MTDGQVYLDGTLLSQGQLPAVDVGMSVSRVGRDAQPEVMKDVASDLRLAVAQYEDVKGFARFGAILDEATTRQIAHGERLTRVLSQPERQVCPLSVQVAEFWALKTGLLNDVPPSEIVAFEQRLLASWSEHATLDEALATAATLGPKLSVELGRWVRQAKASN
jgi:F-type H+-transporting ATPase subunit alpha